MVAGRLIVLQSKDGHALWVSLAVLKSMDPLPEEVEGGVIVRDADGNPTGAPILNSLSCVLFTIVRRQGFSWTMLRISSSDQSRRTSSSRSDSHRL